MLRLPRGRFPMVAVGAVALSSATIATPAGFSFLDLGVQRCGMMAVVASTDDPTAVFHNPAGLTDQHGRSLYFSLLGSRVSSELRLRRDDGTLTENIEPERYFGAAPFLAASSDFGRDDMSFGLALYFPNAYAAALPKDAPTRFHIVDALFVTGYLTAAGAYRVSPRFSLGAGASLIYNELDFTRAWDPATPGVELQGDGDDTAFGWNAGIIWTPRDDLRFGLTYTSRTDLTIEGTLTLQDAAGLEILSTRHSTGMVIPAAYRVGVNYRGLERLEIGFDYTYWDYSIYQEQRTRTDVGIEIVAPKRYGDADNIAVGVKLTLTDRVQLLAGLQRDHSPIPDETYSLDNPTQDLWGLGLGAIYQWKPSTRLAVGYVHNEYDGVNIHDSETTPPTNGIGDGSNDELVVEVLYRF